MQYTPATLPTDRCGFWMITSWGSYVLGSGWREIGHTGSPDAGWLRKTDSEQLWDGCLFFLSVFLQIIISKNSARLWGAKVPSYHNSNHSCISYWESKMHGTLTKNLDNMPFKDILLIQVLLAHGKKTPHICSFFILRRYY